MSNSDDHTIIGAIQDRLAQAPDRLTHRLGDVSEGASRALNDAVNIADDTTTSVQSFVGGLSQEAFETIRTVLDIVEEHITENEFDIQLSDNQIHIEGDSEGLKQITAELRDTERLQGQDIHVEYDRESGIDIRFDSSEE